MKSAIFAALALLSGCGFYADPGPGVDYTYTYTPRPPLGRQAPDAFLIDAFSGTVADPNTYAITTDGATWRLVWLGDARPHKFQGSISCPVGCQFSYARFENAYPGDHVFVKDNYAEFDAVTNGAVPQLLDLDTQLEPITYDLYIDGVPAIGAVVFQSMGQRSTTDAMPFALYSSTGTFSVGDKPHLAPQFISQLPKDAASQTVKVLAPEKASTAASSAGATLPK